MNNEMKNEENQFFKLDETQNAIVFGASRGIGLSMCQALLDRTQAHVYATYRNKATAGELFEMSSSSDRLTLLKVDVTNELQVQEAFSALKEKNVTLNLLISAVGVLHDDEISPEKSLRDFNIDSFTKSLQTNALSFGLISKHFHLLLDRSAPNALIAISAKVGSVSDNRMGGWYSYRASKAALNMLVKNVSIELTRKRIPILTLSVHPGTTVTDLSKPFIKNTPYQLHPPIETANNILNLIVNRSLGDNGKFLSWNNEEIPW